MPGGSTRSDYISGVGVGKVGKFAALQSPGGNGAIVLTFTPTATPICPDGRTQNIRYSCRRAEYVFLEDSPVSNDVYQPESLDTILLSLFSEINYQFLFIVAAVGGFVAGMLVLYFCTRASKEKYVYPNRTEYTPIMEHE